MPRDLYRIIIRILQSACTTKWKIFCGYLSLFIQLIRITHSFCAVVGIQFVMRYLSVILV